MSDFYSSISSLQNNHEDYKGLCCVCKNTIKPLWAINVMDRIGIINIVQCPECKRLDPKSGFQVIHHSCGIDNINNTTNCINCFTELRIDSSLIDSFSFACYKTMKIRYSLGYPILETKRVKQ